MGWMRPSEYHTSGTHHTRSPPWFALHAVHCTVHSLTGLPQLLHAQCYRLVIVCVTNTDPYKKPYMNSSESNIIILSSSVDRSTVEDGNDVPHAIHTIEPSLELSTTYVYVRS